MDNGDGTITDNATALTWTQADSGEGMDWETALAYAQEMNEANYLGYSDWRLPNVKELQSIVDYDYAPDAQDAAYDGPAINPMFSVSEITNEAGDLDYPYYLDEHVGPIPVHRRLLLCLVCCRRPCGRWHRRRFPRSGRRAL